MTDFSFQKYILFGVHSAKSLKRKKNIIFCLKKYKNIWYDLTFLYIQKNSKNIFACIFGFNNQ
jgi:hypothetical protein